MPRVTLKILHKQIEEHYYLTKKFLFTVTHVDFHGHKNDKLRLQKKKKNDKLNLKKKKSSDIVWS